MVKLKKVLLIVAYKIPWLGVVIVANHNETLSYPYWVRLVSTTLMYFGVFQIVRVMPPKEQKEGEAS